MNNRKSQQSNRRYKLKLNEMYKKITTTKMKNSLDGLNIGMLMMEKRINELENRIYPV